MEIPSMAGKTCLVTGANSGIGLETARALAGAGATVVMTARDEGKGRAAVDDVRRSTGNNAVELLMLDLADPDSVRSAAAELRRRHDKLHVLVENAGVILSERSLTPAGQEATFAVNHLGHFLLTALLLEPLKAAAPSRVVVVSSGAHAASRGLPFDDLNRERSYGGFGVYADTKLANLLFVREAARRLEGSGITVNAVHPGGVSTGFSADGDTSGAFRFFWDLLRPLLRTPAKGAETSIHVATSPPLEGLTGGYYANRKPRRPSARARDDEAALKLWEVSEELTGSGPWPELEDAEEGAATPA